MRHYPATIHDADEMTLWIHEGNGFYRSEDQQDAAYLTDERGLRLMDDDSYIKTQWKIVSRKPGQHYFRTMFTNFTWREASAFADQLFDAEHRSGGDTNYWYVDEASLTLMDDVTGQMREVR